MELATEISALALPVAVPVLGVPLLALLTVLGGLVVYVVASRVPVVKRWLI